MSLLNFKLSLYHEIKTVLLPNYGYITEVENEQVSIIPGSSVYKFSHNEIAYADPSGRVTPSGVVLYDSGNIINNDDFEVDYINSTVTLSINPSGSITSDYSFYPIKVIDAFPTAEEFENIDLPLISIDFDEVTTSDYAIGQNESFWDMSYFIDIFGISDSMRLQLMGRLQKSLKKWIPLINFEEAMPIAYNGNINENFNWENQFIKWLKLRGNPRGTLLNLGGLSPKEKYRASIHGKLKDIY